MQTLPRGGRTEYEPARREVPERRRGRSPRWARLCLIGGIVLTVLSGLFVGGSKAFDLYANSKVPHEALLPPDPEGKNISGAINILLLGMDQRGHSTDLIHTDSIIIVHINAAHTAASMVSLPRDSLVSAPAFAPAKFPGSSQLKLTEVFAFGNRKTNANGGFVGDDSAAGRARGVQLVSTVIKSLVPGGLTFNAVAIINYSGFEKLVNALGGVDMCIDEKVWSEHRLKNGKYVTSTGGNRTTSKLYDRGCRHLLPWEALDYVRQREHMELGDSDYGRQRHQQQFLTAVFKELLSKQTMTDPKKFGGLVNAAGGLLTMDLGGNQVLDWIFTLKNIRSSDITMIKTNAGKYSSQKIDGKSFEIITPDTKALLKAVHDDTIDAFLATHPTWIGKTNSI